MFEEMGVQKGMFTWAQNTAVVSLACTWHLQVVMCCITSDLCDKPLGSILSK